MKRDRRLGYTALLMLIAGVVVFNIWLRPSPAEMALIARAQKSDLPSFIRALRVYRQMTGQLPTDGQGLDALVQRPADLDPSVKWEPLGDIVPRDPWGNFYHYFRSNSLPEGFGIYSPGRDGISNSQGNDEDDLNSWSAK